MYIQLSDLKYMYFANVPPNPPLQNLQTSALYNIAKCPARCEKILFNTIITRNTNYQCILNILPKKTRAEQTPVLKTLAR